MWYINRKKQDELVQAIWLGEGAWANNCWGVRDKDDNWLGYLKDADFQSQYGDAMVNNPMIPADDKPHIKDKFCDNLGCIPYIPEQKPITLKGNSSTISAKNTFKLLDVDNEPVFPICGTCNVQKEQDLTKGKLKFYKPSLMLSDAEICEKKGCSKPYCRKLCYNGDQTKYGMQAELDHLAKPEMEIYKQVKCGLVDEYGIPKHTIECVGCKRKCVEYIPLSDYRKGEGK